MIRKAEFCGMLQEDPHKGGQELPMANGIEVRSPIFEKGFKKEKVIKTGISVDILPWKKEKKILLRSI